MLILIAESKTMLDTQSPVSATQLLKHTPAGEYQASEIMRRLAMLSPDELMAETGFTPTLAARLSRMIYEFPNRLLGQKAIQAYTGVVFKALKYDDLTDSQQAVCDRDVRIISSLYGILRPDDIIKPYRLDFTTKVAPSGGALNAYWRKDVTINLVKTIREGCYGAVLNLLPNDAAKCIDWKIVKRFCGVWKIDFAEVTEADTMRTPTATKLKTMRGKMVRQIICDGITGINELMRMESDDFVYEGLGEYSNHLRFLC